MSIVKKIIEVMKDVDYLQKDGKVAYKNTRYNYLSEEKITATIRQSLIKNKIIMFPIDMKETEVTERTDSGNLISRIRATYRIQDIEDDSYIDVLTLGYGMDSGDKGIYKAMTGAFKYAQRETFMISTGDDPDHISSNELNDKTKSITPAKIKQLEGMIKETDTKEKELLGYFKVKDIKSLTYKQYKEAIQLLAKKKEKGK